MKRFYWAGDGMREVPNEPDTDEGFVTYTDHLVETLKLSGSLRAISRAVNRGDYLTAQHLAEKNLRE